ncbi:MAG: molybdate ABC transporter substrate-binding protein [Fibrella sp.]|nr:molybdate ABC transporter substrate-binding protein [Armatimonadota bacterium]
MPEKTVITVAAASSLAPILPALIAAWNREHQTTIRPTFGASGTLLRQIVSGAPIDVFLSAGEKEANEMERLGAVRAGTRAVFAENRLVLAQAKSARAGLTAWGDLLRLPPGFRIALGKPDTVPAGRYAKETLQKRGLYETLQRQGRLVFTGTVRQAADAAATGNVNAALIFATDVRADKRLRTVQTAKAGVDHKPIRYIAIVTKQARNESEASLFVRFLRSEPAKRIMTVAGFAVLDQ